MTARIHIDETAESTTIGFHCARREHATPRVDLHIDFDHDDHRSALDALTNAYDRAVAQIKESSHE